MNTIAMMRPARATTAHGGTLRAFSSSWSKYRIRPAAEWKALVLVLRHRLN